MGNCRVNLSLSVCIWLNAPLWGAVLAAARTFRGSRFCWCCFVCVSGARARPLRYALAVKKPRSRLSGGAPPPPSFWLAPSLRSGCVRYAHLGEWLSLRSQACAPALPSLRSGIAVAPACSLRSVFHAHFVRACASPRLHAPLAPSQAAAAGYATLRLLLLLARSLRYALPSFLGQAPRVPLAARSLRSPMRGGVRLVLLVLRGRCRGRPLHPSAPPFIMLWLRQPCGVPAFNNC